MTQISSTSDSATRARHAIGVSRPRRHSTTQVPFWFLLPALIVFAVVVLYPTVSGAYLAFTDWDGLSAGKNFTGLNNFFKFIHDPNAIGSLGHQLLIALVFTLVQNVFGLGLAVALNSKIKSRYILRTLFFAPAVITPIIIAFLWQYIYSTNGALNSLFGAMGLDGLKQSWLGDPKLALWSIIAVVIWQFSGYAMVIYLAGLQAIPSDVFEAGQMDGAGRWRSFFSITLPLLSPAVTINIILSTIMGLKLFDQVYAMTGGGPGNATQTLTGYQYEQAFTFGNFGYGTMIALVLAVIVSIIAAFQYRFLRRNEESSS